MRQPYGALADTVTQHWLTQHWLRALRNVKYLAWSALLVVADLVLIGANVWTVLGVLQTCP